MPGVGVVTTEFIRVSYLPLFPIQSIVEVTTRSGPMARPLTRLVWRSVVFAYVRVLGGVALGMGVVATMILATSRWSSAPESLWIYGLTFLVALGFGLTWWPFGRVGESSAQDIAQRVGISAHHVAHAFGRVSDAEAAALDTRSRNEREERAALERARYEEGLTAARRRRHPARRPSKGQARG